MQGFPKQSIWVVKWTLWLLLITGQPFYSDADFTHPCITLLAVDYPFKILPEDIPVGTAVLNYTSTADNLQLQPTGETPSGIISLNTTRKAFILKQPLDAETTQELTYTLSCTSYTLRVVFPIEDVNEFPPNFTKNVYFANVSESAEVGEIVYTCKDIANDPDDIGITGYRLINGGGVYFGVRDGGVGNIVVQNQLDYDNGQRSFNLTIEATDSGTPSLSSSATLILNLIDQDDLNPIFDPDFYELSMLENTKGILSASPPIHAYDGDMGINQTVMYEISSVYPPQYRSLFSVNNVTGILSLTQALDRERIDVITMQLKAYQVDKPKTKTAVATIRITVNDSNDNVPIMGSATYSASIPENTAQGAPVVLVSATDADMTSAFSSFTFVLNDTSNAFAIDENTGLITVKNSTALDRETVTHFEMEVYPRDTRMSQKSNSSIVTITLTDVNDNSPVFENNSYTFRINETASVNANVGEVSAADPDSGNNGRIQYSLLSSADEIGSKFNVDGATGQITVIGSLTSLPLQTQYVLVVGAIDQAGVISQRRSTTTVVYILVNDVNNHSPRFLNAPYAVNISEAVTVGTLLLQVQAMDDDFGDKNSLQYLIQSGNDEGLFEIDSDSGNFQLKKKLDREQKGIHTLTLEVTDGTFTNSTSLTITVLDYNDNIPTFNSSSYNFSITDNVNNGDTVGRVFLQDSDTDAENSKVNFTILTGNDQSIFNINIQSGVITVTDHSTLDYNTRKLYLLTIEARDHGTPMLASTTEVRVHILDVNTLPPRFRQDTYLAEIRENMPNNTTVAQVMAVDEDASDKPITYSIVSGDTALFEINGSTGEITAQSLDREMEDFHQLNISAFDGKFRGYALVNITVLDVNDNKPAFMNSHDNTVQLSVNASLGAEVFDARATDSDAENNKEIIYWLTGPEQFIMNYSTGLVSVGSALNEGAYNLTVFAADLGVPPLVSDMAVTVLVTPSVRAPPRFANKTYSVTIPEDKAVSDIVLSVKALDGNTSQPGLFDYTLEGSSAFSIQSNGSIAVNQTLDYESVKSYEFTVKAYYPNDNSLSATATVYIGVTDVNDNHPIFSPVPPIIPITPPSDSSNKPVYKFTATDKDEGQNGKVSYSVQDASSSFYINSTTGVLTGDSNNLTVGKEYSLTILASDEGFPPLTGNISVLIQVINVSQADVVFFTPSAWYCAVLRENSTGDVIVDVNATVSQDPTARLYYNITGGSGEEHYIINETTGELLVVQAADREVDAVHTVLVTASIENDPSKQAIAGVVITIEDINDNEPFFPFKVYHRVLAENTPLNARVIEVQAEDKDLNPNLTYALVNDTSGGLFRIGNEDNKGVVYVKQNLDRETMTPPFYYWLEVSVSDGMYSSQTELQLYVEDINDNPPVFNTTSFYVTVMENQLNGTVVTQMQADDRDSMDAGKLTYDIVPEQTGLFHIDEKTGTIVTERELDRETESSYSFNVSVTDSAGHTAVATVNVTVLDANDNAPMFLSAPTGIIDVQEGKSSLGKVLFNVTVFDADVEMNSQLSISVGGKDGKFFEVKQNGNTGTVQVKEELDRERSHRNLGYEMYNITVKVADSGNPQQSNETDVYIRVNDTNDMPPVFDSKEYNAFVYQRSPPSLPIITVTASDADFYPEFKTISYRIDPTSNPGGMFGMFPNGTVYLNKTLSATPAVYNLGIIADDGLNNDTANLLIRVVAAMDTAPVFNASVYSFDVMESDSTGLYIGRVFAKAADRGYNDAIRFNISCCLGSADKFRIVQNGSIYTDSPLDRENLTENPLILIVSALDTMAVQGRKANAEVRIRVTDINDNAPRFVSDIFTGKVSEDASAGTTIHMIPPLEAEDGDENPGITYLLNPADPFSINKDGVITVAGALDRERQKDYNLTVTAKDGKFNSTARVYIELININDQYPSFSDLSYTFSVHENATLGQNVGVVMATDWDGSDELMYFIEYGDDGKFFINRRTGSIHTYGGLDRETKDMYSLNISAQDMGPNSKSNWTTVIINVMDVNDNPPRFNMSDLIVHIREDVAYETVVTSLGAYDADIGNNVNLTLETPSVPFILSPNGSLQTIGPLDRESKSQYELRVQATDGQLSSTATVKVIIDDVNDNAPVFIPSEYRVSMPDSYPANSVILYASASDPDIGMNGNITYRILGEGSDLFSIDEIGIVKLAKGIIRNNLIDRGLVRNSTGNSTFSVTIQARDRGSPYKDGNATLFVTIVESSDDTPTFERFTYDGTVEEGEAPETVVLAVRALLKNASISLSYRIVGTDDFEIYDPGNSTVGQLIRTKKVLDRESKDSYLFTVVASTQSIPPRQGYAQVKVIVKDINDNAPVFTKDASKFELREGDYTSQSTALGRFTAEDVDQNKTITYSISSGDSAVFTIGSSNGELTAMGIIDRETVQQYTLTIMATDDGVPSKSVTTNVTVVVLDANDNNPVFNVTNPVMFFTPELIGAGIQVGQLSASDADQGLNGIVKYRISGQESPFFYLDFDGDGVAIKTLQNLNYETRLYNFTVTAVDMGMPALSTEVRVTVNVTGVAETTTAMVTTTTADTAYTDVTTEGTTVTTGLYPVFPKDHQLIVNLEENVKQLPQFIIDVNTTEEQQGRNVVYSIIGGNDQNYFFIKNSRIGDLYCNATLDREFKSEYTLEIKADYGTRKRRNTGQPNVLTLTIAIGDVNEKPVFPINPVIFSVPIETQVNTTLGKVTAIDGDTGMNGVLSYSTTSKDVRIDPNTGELSFINKLADKDVTMTVTAQDGGGLSASVEVKIQIIKVDDDNTVILVADIKPEDAWKRREVILRNLTDILGWDIRLKDDIIRPHVNNSKEDYEKTDMIIYAINKTSGSIVPKPVLEAKLASKQKNITDLFSVMRLKSEQTAAVARRQDEELSAAEIALIALGILVVFGTILGIVLLAISWRQREMERKVAEKMHIGHDSEDGIAMVNPAYESPDNLQTREAESDIEPDAKEVFALEAGHEVQTITLDFNATPEDTAHPSYSFSPHPHPPDVINSNPTSHHEHNYYYPPPEQQVVSIQQEEQVVTTSSNQQIVETRPQRGSHFVESHSHDYRESGETQPKIPLPPPPPPPPPPSPPPSPPQDSNNKHVVETHIPIDRETHPQNERQENPQEPEQPHNSRGQHSPLDTHFPQHIRYEQIPLATLSPNVRYEQMPFENQQQNYDYAESPVDSHPQGLRYRQVPAKNLPQNVRYEQIPVEQHPQNYRYEQTPVDVGPPNVRYERYPEYQDEEMDAETHAYFDPEMVMYLNPHHSLPSRRSGNVRLIHSSIPVVANAAPPGQPPYERMSQVHSAPRVRRDNYGSRRPTVFEMEPLFYGQDNAPRNYSNPPSEVSFSSEPPVVYTIPRDETHHHDNVSLRSAPPANWGRRHPNMMPQVVYGRRIPPTEYVQSVPVSGGHMQQGMPIYSPHTPTRPTSQPQSVRRPLVYPNEPPLMHPVGTPRETHLRPHSNRSTPKLGVAGRRSITPTNSMIRPRPRTVPRRSNSDRLSSGPDLVVVNGSATDDWIQPYNTLDTEDGSKV